MKGLFNSILVKKDGEWKHSLSIKQEEYNDMMDTLPEGTKVNITIEVQGKDATYAQMKRIHAMIRQLASDTGSDFIQLKEEIKDKAGLCIEGKCKSFADCDTEELNGAIQAAILLGDFCGSNLR